MIVDTTKNFTPLPQNLTPTGGRSFNGQFSQAFSKFKSKRILAFGSLFAMVIAVMVGLMAARQTATLTTPAQTIENSSVSGDSATAVSCPQGYDQIGTGASSSDEISQLCPSGDFLKMGGGVVNDSSIGTGDGDSAGTSGQIFCCRKIVAPPTEEPQTTPSAEITPNSCIAPEIQIERIELICPNCES